MEIPYRHSVEVSRHSDIPSPSLSDIASGKFIKQIRQSSFIGSGPLSLDGKWRMNWQLPQAGRSILIFDDGLLLLTPEAKKQLPRLPPPPSEPARSKTGMIAMFVAHAVTGPVSPLVDLAGMLVEGAVDMALDRVTDRYEKAHPERERRHREDVHRWQEKLADRLPAIAGATALPRIDIVKVSVKSWIPVIKVASGQLKDKDFDLTLHLSNEVGETSAFTMPMRGTVLEIEEVMQRYFLGRLQREVSWLTAHRAKEDLSKSETSAQVIQGMRQLFSQYQYIPPCAAFLDLSLPGWRSAR